jgi:hypothetical protein
MIMWPRSYSKAWSEHTDVNGFLRVYVKVHKFLVKMASYFLFVRAIFSPFL